MHRHTPPCASPALWVRWGICQFSWKVYSGQWSAWGSQGWLRPSPPWTPPILHCKRMERERINDLFGFSWNLDDLWKCSLLHKQFVNTLPFKCWTHSSKSKHIQSAMIKNRGKTNPQKDTWASIFNISQKTWQYTPKKKKDNWRVMHLDIFIVTLKSW